MHGIPLITTLVAAFTAAWVLGLITQRLRLSPIVGYLLAGIVIGPHTPITMADPLLASELAEIGVLLLMFGVGLHFHVGDLLKVKDVAIPGAIVQTLLTATICLVMTLAFGWSLKASLLLGIALAVSSTVVVVRVLTDNRLLESTAGHVTIGWLIVQDVLTVVVLVLVPAMGNNSNDSSSLWLNLLMAPVKLGAMVLVVFVGGSKVVPWIMVNVARLRSRELFTLTILVMAISVAAAAAYLFGASMALGAFLAGMVVGQSPVAQQAAADALPLRDAFAVLFFTSVGMLFDPAFIVHQPALLLGGLAVVLIAKPIISLAIVSVLGYDARTALVVALGLAQIGEFSFILAELGKRHHLLDHSAENLLVACAIATIALNPLLFLQLPRIETALTSVPPLWKLLNARARKREDRINQQVGSTLEAGDKPLAVILGYGPVGRAVDSVIRKTGLDTVVVDLNMDTVRSLTKAGRSAFYGDAFNIEVMYQALARATHLVITLPHSANRNPLIASAKLINPDIMIFVRARYISERPELLQSGADAAVFEELEAAVALAKSVLFDRGADPDQIHRETVALRQSYGEAI